MTIEELKSAVIKESKRIGIDKIGFTSADIFVELKEHLRNQQNNNYASGFEKGSIDERTEPQKLLKEAKSIISIALAYPSRIKNPPKSTKEARRGIFCRASWGQDYHDVLKEKLNQLMTFIKQEVPEVKYEIMVDTGELVDGAVAERAGVGFTGKNTLLITKEFGSYVYLGEILLSIPFKPDVPLTLDCGTCRKCIDVCPTGAIVEGGKLNAQQCLAFQTQKKHFIKDEFKELIGTRVYGCDTCQAVCPYNKGIDFHNHKEFEPDPEVAKPQLKPMLNMSNREFRAKFGHVAGFWRGKNPLQRNAMIGLAHYKDITAIDDLINVLQTDVRPAMRGTAAWSLGKIGTEKAYKAIETALKKETDETARSEMAKGLSFKNNHSTRRK